MTHPALIRMARAIAEEDCCPPSLWTDSDEGAERVRQAYRDRAQAALRSLLPVDEDVVDAGMINCYVFHPMDAECLSEVFTAMVHSMLEEG